MSGINEVDIVFSTIARNYLHLAGFNVEVEHLWRRKKFGSAFWFFLNRYSSLLGNLASTILWMIPLNTNVSVFASYSIVLVDLRQDFANGGSYFHRAIFQWSQTVGNRDKPSGLSECVTWYSQHAAVIHKTIHTAVSARCPDHNGRLPLTTIILRDGLMYFFMMILANAANVVTYIVANPYYKGIMTSFSCCVSSAMMSRLILNLHEGVPFPTISTDNRSSKASVVGIDRAPPTAPSSFLLSNDYPPTVQAVPALLGYARLAFRCVPGYRPHGTAGGFRSAPEVLSLIRAAFFPEMKA
ncbi:hypothetical protein FISHEDRAFT_59553 [Fistulina hepatica ATCC 64428]|uniref:Uncharacterized protein n=1 Tax=Fistulina hepatica ATCC 64428 TaxID=1128425 RepID=A0A0D7A9A1_9AGAR|nr:hypothetical protein FISHEDRAFT_59553 [Fistulina hepatica ATCC 64428]